MKRPAEISCPICLDKKTDYLTLPCEHGICDECFDLLYEFNPKKVLCPLCRYVLLEVKEADILNQESIQDEYAQTEEYDYEAGPPIENLAYSGRNLENENVRNEVPYRNQNTFWQCCVEGSLTLIGIVLLCVCIF